MLTENKLGPKNKLEKHDIKTSKTFAWRSIDIYNHLPRQLTLLKNHLRFKICMKKLTLNPQTMFIIPKQDDYKYDAKNDMNNALDFSCP